MGSCAPNAGVPVPGSERRNRSRKAPKTVRCDRSDGLHNRWRPIWQISGRTSGGRGSRRSAFRRLALQLDVVLEPHLLDHVELLFEHVDMLEKQFDMIEQMGLQNYVQLQSKAAEG